MILLDNDKLLDHPMKLMESRELLSIELHSWEERDIQLEPIQVEHLLAELLVSIRECIERE